MPVDQFDQFFNTPQVIRYPGFHRWRHSQRVMPTDEIVMEEMQGDGVLMVFDLLAECVRIRKIGDKPLQTLRLRSFVSLWTT